MLNFWSNATRSSDTTALLKDYFELREKIGSIKETDLLQLRDRLKDIETTLKHWRWAITIGSILLTALGISSYLQFRDRLNSVMQQKVEESLGYYSEVSRAVTMTNFGRYGTALPVLRELSEKRQDDEIVFMNLVECYIQLEDFEAGYKYILELQAKKLFPSKFQDILSFNNAGFVVWVKSLSDKALEREARDLLDRAERLAMNSGSPDLHYPLMNLALLHLSVGEMAQASSYADRWRALAVEEPNWPTDMKKVWFKRLEAKRPTVRNDIKVLFHLSR